MTEHAVPASRILTLVFTDLVESTALKAEHGDDIVEVLIARHREHITRLATETGGRIIDWAGDGCFLTFETASTGVSFALRLQQAHGEDSELPPVRIGAHMGEVTDKSGPAGAPRVEGLAVDIAARIQSLALPGQLLMSAAVFDNARQRLRNADLGGELEWRAHGQYVLKGFDEPLQVCEVGVAGLSPLTPPEGSEKAQRALAPGEEDTLGWRPAVGQPIPRRDHWILESRLGQGGFGEVWLAVHEKTKAKRVFKFCFEPERVRGLKREVVLFRLLKETLGHRDDIAQVVDWEFERAPYFLESEYTEGGDLKDWVESKGGFEKIPPETRLELVAQAAMALGAAHSVGVLHKDIKPGNILVTDVPGQEVPRACLTDFGIGLITDPAALAAQDITAAGLTQTLIGSSSSDSDSGAGTRLYMAPELLEGKPATTLSDIYSLGIVLYQMVIGDLSHAAAVGWERDIKDDLLREDIALCIDGDPGRRLKSADELAERLRSLPQRRARREEERRIREEATRAKRRRRAFLTVSAIGATITVAVGLVALREYQRAETQERLRAEAVAAQTEADRERERAIAARNEAELQRREADALRAEAERGQYVASIRLTASLLDEDNVVAAKELLLATPAQHRNWEWGRLVNRAWPPEDNQETGLPQVVPGNTAADYWRGESARLVITLVGHDAFVNDIEFLPEGQRVITASVDQTYRIWDIETGEELESRELEESADQLQFVLSPDGRLMATSYQGTTGALLDVETGELLHVLEGHTEGVRPFAFSDDGAYLLTGGMDRNTFLWDVQTGEIVRRFPRVDLEGTLFPDGAFIPGTTHVICTAPHNRVVVWDVETGATVREVQGPNPNLFVAGRLSEDGNSVLSWSRELGSHLIWDSVTGTEIFSGSWGTSLVEHPLTWSGDGTAVLVRIDDSAFVAARDESTGWNFPQKPIPVNPMMLTSPGAFSRNGALIALAGPKGTVRIYAPASKPVSPEDATPGHGDICYTATYSPDGRILATAGFDGNVVLHDSRSLEVLRQIDAHDGEITTVRFSPNGRYIYTFGYDDYSRLWDASSGAMVFESKGHLPDAFAGGARGPAVRFASHLVGGGSFSPSSDRIVHPAGAGRVIVRTLPSAEVLFEAKYDGSYSYKNSFSPDGDFLLNLPYLTTHLTLFNAHTGEAIAQLRGHEAQIVDRRFSPDGARILTTSTDQTARLWDGRTGEPLHVFDNHSAQVFTGNFSPDGELIATGSFNGVTKIWRSETGEEVLQLSGHGGTVKGVGFSLDGRRLFTAGLDNVVRLWNLSGDILAELRLGEGETLYYTTWSPDGRDIVMTSSNGTARVWRAVDWTAFGETYESPEDFATDLARSRY